MPTSITDSLGSTADGDSHRKQADLRSQARKTFAEMVDILTVMQTVSVDMLCFQRPFVVKEVGVHILVLMPAQYKHSISKILHETINGLHVLVVKLLCQPLPQCNGKVGAAWAQIKSPTDSAGVNNSRNCFQHAHTVVDTRSGCADVKFKPKHSGNKALKLRIQQGDVGRHGAVAS